MERPYVMRGALRGAGTIAILASDEAAASSPRGPRGRAWSHAAELPPRHVEVGRPRSRCGELPPVLARHVWHIVHRVVRARAERERQSTCSTTAQFSPLARIIAPPELPRVRDPHGARAVRKGRRVGHLATVPPQELEQVAAARRVAEVRVHQRVASLGDEAHRLVVLDGRLDDGGEVGPRRVQLAVLHQLHIGRLLLDHHRVEREQLEQPVRVRVAIEADKVFVLGVTLHRHLLHRGEWRERGRDAAKVVVRRHVPNQTYIDLLAAVDHAGQRVAGARVRVRPAAKQRHLLLAAPRVAEGLTAKPDELAALVLGPVDVVARRVQDVRTQASLLRDREQWQHRTGMQLGEAIVVRIDE
eukprot:scaffold59233_cov67-Phaeocystis_antarctica.AAC.2